MEKILILAHDDPVAGYSVIPNFKIRGPVEIQAKHMPGFMPAGIQKTAKRIRKLVIHQELHALVSTTWSVNREA